MYVTNALGSFLGKGKPLLSNLHECTRISHAWERNHLSRTSPFTCNCDTSSSIGL